MGSERMTHEYERIYHKKYNHKRIARLMKKYGLLSVVRPKIKRYGICKSVYARNKLNRNFQADTFNMGMRDNLIIYSPSTMKEIQSAVDCLRQNQSVMLDLEKIGDEDRTRVLDFISGAIYGLNGSIHRFKDDSFILTPEGKKILTPDKKD